MPKFKPILRTLFLTLTLLVPAFIDNEISAQEQIMPDEPIAGTLNSDNYLDTYEFEGKAGEPWVFVMRGHGDMDDPELMLQAPNGEILLNTEEVYNDFGNYREAIIMIDLPDDGTYSLFATRTDGAEGTASGNYSLTMITPLPLTDGQTHSDQITSDESWDFYTYTPDQIFSVFYWKLDGTYQPEISVSIYNPVKDKVDTVGYLIGDQLTFGGLGWFDMGETYFITVGKHNSTSTTNLYYFSGEAVAKYELEIRFPAR